MSFIAKLSQAVTDVTIPSTTLDPVVNAGTSWLFDFTNPYCNTNPAGNLAAGSTFRNLVEGAADAVVVRPAGTTAIENLAALAGLRWNASSAFTNIDQVDLGSGYSFAPSTPFVIGVWLKQAADGNTAAYQPVARRTLTNANASQWIIDSGASGNNHRGNVGNLEGTSSTGPSPSAVQNLLARDVVHHVAFSYQPGANGVRLWHNGAEVSPIGPITGPAELRAEAATHILLALAGKGSIYRFWSERYALADRTAAQAVAQEWSLNTGRFV
ncbi:hypothetical protein [Devosia sp. Root635]|uniref:hypothetical protein n=1 Tax=Devosia sp. Root635 TaxID=1736575 RepID=UPI0006F85F67|nr:hypothetical protein [Devosia sp. Root635]KRA44708.1 hypothetical protein ASD80_06080 [Devosia sp. Root635]